MNVNSDTILAVPNKMESILVNGVLWNAADWLPIKSANFNRFEDILHRDVTQRTARVKIMGRMHVGRVFEMKVTQFVTCDKHCCFLAVI